jgi:thiol-disulfide isomerase/thioredoxin
MRAPALALCLVPLLLVGISGCDRRDRQADEAEAPQSLSKGVDRSQAGHPIPSTELFNPEEEKTVLAEASGKQLLVNLWASWCAPCVKELPTLDRLATAHSGARLRVIAVSQDSGPQPSVEAFLAKLKVEELGAYHDPKMGLLGALGPDVVLPTSILYDAQGREVWRYVGDLDWTGPEAARLLSEAGASATG